MNPRSFPSLLVCTIVVANVMNSTFIADSFAKSEFAGAWWILTMVSGPFLLFVEVIALGLKDNSGQSKSLFVKTQKFSGALYVVALVILIIFRE